ncbi:hypothetical protein A2U01_0091944, partial [Trifolium medium]|nr:hypothetical protein [Trifolium medium]
EGPESGKGRKKSKTSTSRIKHAKGKKELKVNQELILSDYDGTDEDWREFLRTLKPHESHRNASSSDEEDGTITEEPQGRVL